MWPSRQFFETLVTFTEEILNGKLQFLCSAGNDKKVTLIRKWFVTHIKDKKMKTESSLFSVIFQTTSKFAIVLLKLIGKRAGWRIYRPPRGIDTR